MRLYPEPSALVRVYVEEQGSAHRRQTVAGPDLMATSALAGVEPRAAFARRRREGGLPARSYRRVIADLDEDWSRYAVVDVTESVIRQGVRLAERHRLRAHDAVHLASAAAGREVGRAERMVFASWDTVLGRATHREDFSLLAASA